MVILSDHNIKKKVSKTSIFELPLTVIRLHVCNLHVVKAVRLYLQIQARVLIKWGVIDSRKSKYATYVILDISMLMVPAVPCTPFHPFCVTL